MVCKTVIHRFDPGRRLHSSLPAIAGNPQRNQPVSSHGIARRRPFWPLGWLGRKPHETAPTSPPHSTEASTVPPQPETAAAARVTVGVPFALAVAVALLVLPSCAQAPPKTFTSAWKGEMSLLCEMSAKGEWTFHASPGKCLARLLWLHDQSILDRGLVTDETVAAHAGNSYDYYLLLLSNQLNKSWTCPYGQKLTVYGEGLTVIDSGRKGGAR